MSTAIVPRDAPVRKLFICFPLWMSAGADVRLKGFAVAKAICEKKT
ncbi:hypothetical protein VCJ71_02295 [Alteriqipengyuania sp. WL0013]|nr:hypothetical protein [Alteriqipengyuania sp. WL0013]MEB3414890.1 hypothetical protein [Alteriqipengyuania sp. WL0013]